MINETIQMYQDRRAQVQEQLKMAGNETNRKDLLDQQKTINKILTQLANQKRWNQKLTQ